MNRHDALTMAARIGLAVRGAVYLLIGGIAAWGAILGGGASETGPADAFRSLESAPFGQVLVAVIALGLLLYSGWRFIQGIMDADGEGDDAKGRLARVGMVSSGISYLLVAIAAGSVLLGDNSSGSNGGATETTARFLLGQPFGQVLLGLAGLAMGAVGAAQIWRAVTKQYEKSLAQDETVRSLRPACMFGIAGRGVIFIIIGVFILLAALHGEPDEAMGAAEAMGWLRDQPFGLALYLAAAFALLGYAVYSFIQARYRRIGADVAP